MAPPKGRPSFNTKGEGGRPIEWTEERINDAADNLNKWLDNAQKHKKEFWWKDWCFDYGCLPQHCPDFARKNDKFLQAYQRAKAWQESLVCKGALVKKFDGSFSKFFLINTNPKNWKEKQDDVPRTPPQQDNIDKDQEIMKLKYEIEMLKNGNKSETE